VVDSDQRLERTPDWET